MDAVHAEGGYIYAQLWHAGRAANPAFTGYGSTVSSSATRFEGEGETRYPAPDENGEPKEGERVLLRDVPVRGMRREEIRGTIADFVGAARRAVDVCGFDGVEVHGGNGYLVEQFLSTNVNKREDGYGGDVEGYVRFPMELMLALRDAVGGERLAMRLTPFGLFNQMKGENRVEIWSHLCRKMKDLIPDLSYVHFIEPVSYRERGGIHKTDRLTAIRADYRLCYKGDISQDSRFEDHSETVPRHYGLNAIHRIWRLQRQQYLGSG